MHQLSAFLFRGTVSFADCCRCVSSPFDSVTKVIVGPARRNPTTFYVHDTLLVASSPFFRACLTHSCEESVSGVIKLPTDRADTFSLFLQWLYHQHSCSLVNVPASQSSHLLDGSSMLPDTPACPSITDTPVPRIAPKFFPYLRLYIFAFRYFLPFALKNAIVDRITQLADTYNSVPNIDDVKLLWDELPPGAKLRDLVLDLFTWYVFFGSLPTLKLLPWLQSLSSVTNPDSHNFQEEDGKTAERG